MLEIICYYKSAEEHLQSGKTLDLFPETSLDIIWENPLFKVDEISVSFSLDFTAPPSTHNLSIFNFPNKVPAFGVIARIPAAIRHTGVKISEGELLLINFDKALSLQFKGSIEEVDQKMPLNEINIGEKEWTIPYPDTGLTASGHIDYTDAAWDDYVNDALSHSNQLAPYQAYCHGVIKKNGGRWDGHEAVGGVLNSIGQYINFFNANLGSHRMETSAWYNPSDPWTVGGEPIDLGDPTKRFHTPVIPFFPLHKVIRAGMHTSLQSNPYLSGDLAKIILIGANHPNNFLDFVYNSFHVHLYSLREVMFPISEAASGNVKWAYKSFMQAYQFNEFLKDVLKIFSQTLFRGIRSSIEYKDDTFGREVVRSWDDKLDGDLVITRENGKEYRFEYAGESSDFEADVYELSTWEDVYNAAIDQMSAGVVTDDETESEFFFKVPGSPQIVGITKTLRGLHNTPWLKTRIVKTALGHDKPEADDDVYRVISNVKPLNMSIEQYWWLNRNITSDETPIDVINKRHWHVPVMPSQTKEAAPYIMFFGGKKQGFPYGEHSDTDEYTYITNHHTDHKGVKHMDFSLIPECDDGIVDTFHQGMKKWVEKDKAKIQGDFVLDIHDLHKLNMRDKIYIRGRLFYIEKIQFTLTPDRISKSDVTLIEA